MKRAKTKRDLFILRSIIKGFAVEAKDIRKKRINKLQGRDKYYAWQDKRLLGYQARVHMLAYALLQGRDRKDIEKIRKNDVTDPMNDSWFLTETAKRIQSICLMYGGSYLHWYSDLSIDNIVLWLRGEENVLFSKDKTFKNCVAQLVKL